MNTESASVLLWIGIWFTFSSALIAYLKWERQRAEMEARHTAERERLKQQVERWVNDERARYEPEKPKRIPEQEEAVDWYYLADEQEEDASWMD